MQHQRSIWFLILMVVTLLALGACAPAAGAGTTGSAGTPTGTSTAAPPAGSTPTGGATTSGAVTLVLNKSSYGPDDPLEVTIQNGLKTMIFAADHQSECTLVQLQHQDGRTWQAVGSCRLEIQTRIVSLNPGSATLQVLSPGTGLNATGPWPAGTYRIAFTYQAGGAEGSGQRTLVYSANFVVS